MTSSLAARQIFKKRLQQQGENIEAYAAALKVLAQDCRFGDNLDENLRDQLVYGIANEKIKETFYETDTEELTPTFKDVYDKAVSMERVADELAARLRFRERKQQSWEIIEDYVTALKMLAEDCKMRGEELVKNLRDQLIHGIADEDIREKLSAEVTLTFNDVYEMAVSLERKAAGSRFRERKQQPWENIEAYVMALKTLAQECYIGEDFVKSLRNQLIRGIADKDIREKLSAEVNLNGLDFNGVYEMAVSLEREAVKRQLLKEKAPSHGSSCELNKFEKNILIIFNHEKFDDGQKREGTQEDVKALTNTFEKYNFKVDNCEDKTKAEIITKLKEFSKEDLSSYGCVAVAVLTHGEEDGLLKAKDDEYNETEIIELLKDNNNKTLATIPRVIIFQACRGGKDSVAVAVNSAETGTTIDCASPVCQRDIVPEGINGTRNMLILHSCFPGSPSYRHQLSGSWCIQDLCTKITELGDTEDLATILRKVLNEIAINREVVEADQKDTSKLNINKQMPVITNNLGTKLYLGKKPVLIYQLKPSSSIADLNFNFLEICLTNYVEENPQDEAAAEYLDLAKVIGVSTKHNTHKTDLSQIILEHLLDNSSKYTSPKKITFGKKD